MNTSEASILTRLPTEIMEKVRSFKPVFEERNLSVLICIEKKRPDHPYVMQRIHVLFKEQINNRMLVEIDYEGDSCLYFDARCEETQQVEMDMCFLSVKAIVKRLLRPLVFEDILVFDADIVDQNGHDCNSGVLSLHANLKRHADTMSAINWDLMEELYDILYVFRTKFGPTTYKDEGDEDEKDEE